MLVCPWIKLAQGKEQVFYRNSSHFFPTTLLTGNTWLVLLTRRYRFCMKPCAASSLPSLPCSTRAHLVLLFETIHAEALYQEAHFGKCFMTPVLRITTALCLKCFGFFGDSETTLSTRYVRQMYKKCLCAKCENSICSAMFPVPDVTLSEGTLTKSAFTSQFSLGLL